MNKTAKNISLISLGGFLAGFANGLLGAGGGIIIVFVLSKALRSQSPHPRDIFANALCVMFPLSIVSTIIYALRGTINLDGFFPYLIPAAVGGIAGGLLLGRINENVLKKIFSAIMIFSGIMLVLK